LSAPHRRVLLDTHAWIWWRSDPAQLSGPAAQAIDRAEVLGLSAISVFELAAKVAKNKLTLSLPVDDWLGEALAHPRLRLLDVTVAIAQDAGTLGRSWTHGDPADRMLVATALSLGWPIVSKDGRIRESGLVQVLW